MTDLKFSTPSRGVTDGRDRLLKADDHLANLQRQTGGSIPGPLAIPELLDLVRQARDMNLKIARDFSAFNGREMVRGFARICPLAETGGEGCELLIENWRQSPGPWRPNGEMSTLLDEADRSSAGITARLDQNQRLKYASANAPDAAGFCDAVDARPGLIWCDYVEFTDHDLPGGCDWKFLDSALCSVPGSEREWRARLIPVFSSRSDPDAFELLLIPEQPLVRADEADGDGEASHSRLIGTSLTPVLRQPIARIIANAETIRSRLAGPLRDEYSAYAGHIVSAGQHLSGMLEDLADLEVVEAPDFTTAIERVHLADAARRAAGILGVLAQSRRISIDFSAPEANVEAAGEFRRVLQIILNLLSNAIAYSPEDTQIVIGLEEEKDAIVGLTVTDEGPGISSDESERIFAKFERLGRESDSSAETGSGLGLYISRRLARAMGGDLKCVAPSGSERRGAIFRLTLPAA